MLRELRIKNLAIIDDLRVTFESGFNVLTGETGAGKSIIVDALSVVLGKQSAAGFYSIWRKRGGSAGVCRCGNNI